MRKKLLIGLLVCGIVGDGGVCAHELWVTPYSLTAEFTGKKPYIYDTLNKKDIIVKEKNIFGHEDAVSDFTINADTLKECLKIIMRKSFLIKISQNSRKMTY